MKLIPVLVIGFSAFFPNFASAITCVETLLPEGARTGVPLTYVLDTNILLNKPSAFLDFGTDQTVAITEQTLRELEAKKTDAKLGWSAREFFRLFAQSTGSGSLSGPVALANGSKIEILTVGTIDDRSPESLRLLDLGPGSNPDNKILAAMLQYRQGHPEREVVFVSADEAFRVVARIHDFQLGRYVDSQSKVLTTPKKEETSYTGLKRHLLPEEDFQSLYAGGEESKWRIKVDRPSEFYENQFVVVREADPAIGAPPVVLRYHGEDQTLRGLRVNLKSYVKNIKPKNLEQRMALELLTDPNITAVTLFGKPGSGKTLITMAAALQQHEKNIYEKIYYAKPYKHTGGEDALGFLKGDFDEKTGAWHESFVDNLEPIYGLKEVQAIKRKFGDKPNDILRNFNMEPLKIGYARGRSIAKAFIIIDEAQNLSHIELKTLLTRIGEGSKIVLMGDLGQIDLTALRNPESSPFFKLVNSEAYKNSPLSGHSMLIEGLRSPTTDMFNDVFDEIEGRKH